MAGGDEELEHTLGGGYSRLKTGQLILLEMFGSEISIWLCGKIVGYTCQKCKGKRWWRGRGRV
jgi:hypothetical protein